MTDKVTNADTLLERLRIAGARIRTLSTLHRDEGEQLDRVSLIEPLGPLDAYTDVHVGAFKALLKRGALAFGPISETPLGHGDLRIEQFATLKPEPEVAHDPAALLIDGIAIAAIPVGADDDSVEEGDEGMVIISVIVKGVSTPIVRFPIGGHVRGLFSPDDIRAAIARERGGSAALTREPVKSRAKRSKKEPRVVIATEEGADIGTMEPGETVIAVFPGPTLDAKGSEAIAGKAAAMTADDAFGGFLP